MFEKFPSLTRFSHGWTVTEKLDGSNAAIAIIAPDDMPGASYGDGGLEVTVPPEAIDYVGGFFVFAQSRSKLIYPGKQTDNYGFAQFVKDNAEEIVAKLGEGRHFGEWVGKGVNARGYNLDQKQFVLFNTHRWTGADLPERVSVVPVLAEGYIGEPGSDFALIMAKIQQDGSVFAPGFMNPEGIVMRHGPSGTLFKKTFDYDEQGKWAENEARRNAAA